MFNLREFLGLNYYVSELDQFLRHFDHTHPNLTNSQQREKSKYDRIHALRDRAQPQPPVSKQNFWDKF